MDPFRLLTRAFEEAQGKGDAGDSDGEIHRNRSRNLVDSLARGFQGYYRKIVPGVQVFWSGNDTHQSEFNLKELLFDIAVCEVDETPSATGRALLPYVKSTLWIVESEFERDSRSAIVDMSKLVMGRSENALFIAPTVGPKQGYLDMLAKVAVRCDCNLYLALIGHPSTWKSSPSIPEEYVWATNEWRPAGRSAP